MAVDPNYIQLTPEQQKRLAELANETGKPWPEVFSEALRSYRPARDDKDDAHEESLFDSLCRRGLVGCIKDAPADLSTNPKHMEGFGKSDYETSAH